MSNYSKEEIEDIKENIKLWEEEKDRALKENDIMRAVECRLLANHLRKCIGEEEL